MSTTAPAMTAPVAPWRRLGLTLPVLAVGVALILVLFQREVLAAIRVWNTSTAYGHCYFVLPIALYLAWDRRFATIGVPVRPWPWAALAAIPLGVAWIAAERMGIMEGQQFAVLGFIELLFLAVLGWRMFWVMSVPLLYLVFLVPSGAFLTPALQDFTARFITVGLDVLGIAYVSDGYTIDIPEGSFYVAEACAGLRFLIASIAFGTLYAFLIYRSPVKRVAFIAVSIVIPIIANGFRGLGIVVLGHVIGSAEAAAADHLIYGWIFFSVVILLLILAGLPFREDIVPPTAPVPAATQANPRPPSGLAAFGTAAIVLGLTAVAPATANWFDRQAIATVLTTTTPSFLTDAGCIATPPVTPQAWTRVWGFVCTRYRLPVTVQMFPPRSNPQVLLTAQRQATGEYAAEDAVVSSLNGPGGVTWRLVNTRDPDRVVAAATWINGETATGGLSQRLQLARNSMFGSSFAPLLVTVSTPPVDQLSPVARHDARLIIEQFLAGQPDWPARFAKLGASWQQ